MENKTRNHKQLLLASLVVVILLGSSMLAQSVFAVTDNSHKKGAKSVGNGVPDDIKACILQHLNDPKYYHIGVGHCINPP